MRVGLNSQPGQRLLIGASGFIMRGVPLEAAPLVRKIAGNAYRFNLSGGAEMDGEGFAAAGGNQSQTHTDFMIGFGELNVDGISGDGTAEAVLRDVEWAF